MTTPKPDWRKWPDLFSYELSAFVDRYDDGNYLVIQSWDGSSEALRAGLAPGDRSPAERVVLSGLDQSADPWGRTDRVRIPLGQATSQAIGKAFPLSRVKDMPIATVYRDSRSWEIPRDGIDSLEAVFGSTSEFRKTLGWGANILNRQEFRYGDPVVPGRTGIEQAEVTDDVVKTMRRGRVTPYNLPAWIFVIQAAQREASWANYAKDIEPQSWLAKMRGSALALIRDLHGLKSGVAFQVDLPNDYFPDDSFISGDLGRMGSTVLSKVENTQTSFVMLAHSEEDGLCYTEEGLSALTAVNPGEHLITSLDIRSGGAFTLPLLSPAVADRYSFRDLDALINNIQPLNEQMVLLKAGDRLNRDLERKLAEIEPENLAEQLEAGRTTKMLQDRLAEQIRDYGVKQLLHRSRESEGSPLWHMTRVMTEIDASWQSAVDVLVEDLKHVESVADVEQLGKRLNDLKSEWDDRYGWTARGPVEAFNTAAAARQQQLIDDAAAAAKAENAKALNSVSSEARNKPSEKTRRHEDAGQKLGGARKDYYRVITTEKAEQLTTEELATYVKKNSVWPTLDVEALREDGYDGAVVRFMQEARRLVDPEPRVPTIFMSVKRGKAQKATDPEQIRAYVSAVSQLQGFFDDIKTEEDLVQRMGALDNLLSDYAGISVDSDPSIRDVLGRRFKQKMYGQYGPKEVLRKAAFDHRVAGWEDLLTNKRRRRASNPDAAKLPRPAHLEHVTREGRNWREDRDVTGEDLVEVFGFRGIEYGNWVSHKERQEVLNLAYDSLMDLADVLKVPPRFIGFDNSLGLAFGSRGRGGKAAAHYEFVADVINLTKLNGAGFVAHEWFHALDSWIGRQTGFQVPGESLASTHLIKESELTPALREHSRENCHAKIDKDLGPGLSTQLAKRLLDVALDARIGHKTQDDVAQDLLYRENHLMSWLSGEMKRNGLESAYSSEAESQSKAILLGVMSSESLAEDAQRRSMGIPEFVLRTTVSDALESAGSAKPFFDIDLRKNAIEQFGLSVGPWTEAHNIQKKGRTPGLRYTDFHTEAMKLDGIKKASSFTANKAKYWGTPHEELARAFACYVHDKLAAEGAHNDYLVTGVEPGVFADKQVYRGNSNPEGAERAVIAERMDGLFDVLAIVAHDALSEDEDASPVCAPG